MELHGDGTSDPPVRSGRPYYYSDLFSNHPCSGNYPTDLQSVETMENRGYEDDTSNLEHQQAAGEESNCPEVESHVYEDIVVNRERKMPNIQNAFQNHLDMNTPWTSDDDHHQNPFQRNLTLPLRRDRGELNKEEVIRYSVRVTSSERLPQFSCENKPSCESSVVDLSTEKPTRRRRKKDCKHCKMKAGDEATQKEKSLDTSRSIIEPIFTLPDGRLPSFSAPVHNSCCVNSSCTVFAISNNVNGICQSSNYDKKPINYDKNDVEPRLGLIEEDRALLTPQKHRTGMKVNSIYSQEQWKVKDSPIFFTDYKDQPFQRAYSLPVRSQSPNSQNRVNLRRSVRGEPPPPPPRLRKNRHGWTLHLTRPLDGTGCTRSIILLLIVILALLGIGAIALYIVFEPEKLQIIQQYLRSGDRNDSLNFNYTTLPPHLIDDLKILEETTTISTVRIPSTTNPPYPETSTSIIEEQETETPEVPTEISPQNYTRHCDDCYKGEVCVALVGEDVPICRIGPDQKDPTGCSGLCLINKQRCHRLDTDAFRCVEVEHYCLDDEWTCINTLCIPSVKRCDGHMNCYDHSDEYNCICDLQTHFQCGNETSCMPLEKRCDGKIDCWDATDEINCTLGEDLGLSCLSANEFTCSSGQCILKNRFCDGLRDCSDGSDEPSGCQGRCNKHEFTCGNGRCITRGLKCNGNDDCGDKSDEQRCRDRIPRKKRR